ncbi:MAG: GNAT family N-acetyltransferase [Desulfobulbus sp.]
MKVNIVPATLVDCNDLARMEEELFVCDRISIRQFRYLIGKTGNIVVKALVEGRLAGAMVLLIRKSSLKLRLYSIAVFPWARELGVARRMLNFAEQTAQRLGCRAIVLEVGATNREARCLYTTSGFIECGTKPGYYEDGSDAVRLVKQISPCHGEV